jgi:hypothetical protein
MQTQEGELPIVELFVRFLGRKGKQTLTPDQYAVAEAIFKTAGGRRLLGGVAATGKTFLFNKLEQFAHELGGRNVAEDPEDSGKGRGRKRTRG